MVQRIRDAALVLIAADALGGAQHCTHLSVDYAKTREQFGQPIGRFQGLKHQLAHMALDVEPSRAQVWYAAYAWDAELPDATRAAAMAKAHLCEVYTRTTRAAIAAHGGIGYTWEYGLNYWFRRSVLDRAWLGMAWLAALGPNTGENSPRGKYLSQCAICHGDKLAGSPPSTPSLVTVGSRLSPQQIASTIKNGKGRMPGFSNLSAEQLSSLVDFLTSGESKEVASNEPIPPGISYRFTGYRRFLDEDGYPAIAPPWGTLNAIDLNTGEYVWKINLGEYPELASNGMANTGSENYGGPVVTAGGLLFIGATNYDKKFRAFDKSTGRLLWETTLPFAGNATPATYAINGRQYVVIAAGGGKDLKSPSGGVYVAFALPDKGTK